MPRLPTHLPLPQLSQLSLLRVLSLHLCSCSPEGYAPLAALRALRQLALAGGDEVPGCLSSLTALQVGGCTP